MKKFTIVGTVLTGFGLATLVGAASLVVDKLASKKGAIDTETLEMVKADEIPPETPAE